MPISNITNLEVLVGSQISPDDFFALTETDSNFENYAAGWNRTDGTFEYYLGSQGGGFTKTIVKAHDNVTINDEIISETYTGTILEYSFTNQDGNLITGYMCALGQNAEGLFIYELGANNVTVDENYNVTNATLSVKEINFLVEDGSVAPPFDTLLTGSYDFDPAPFASEGLACFAAGTRIRTLNGDCPVEVLEPGMMVITASGKASAVKWLASSLSRPSRHHRPWEVHPVCIRAGAFAEGLPERDLRVSPGHALYVDGVLIPAGHLINGATIVQEEIAEIRYYHVELDNHDVILAEGLPCESYLDDGNRKSFANAGEFTEIHGRLDPRSWDDACAPMVAEGPQLVEVQQRLHARAEALGWIKSDAPALRLAAGDAEIAPLHRAGNRFWFAVPSADSVVLRSNAGILGQIMPGLGDNRRLGVAVADLRVDGVTVALDDVRMGAGFYPLERHEDHAWRWTEGSAELALGLAAPAMVEVTLAMIAPSWVRPAPELRVVA